MAGVSSPRYRDIFVSLASGVGITLRVAALAYVAALLLAIVIAVGLVSRHAWLREPLRAYVEVMRGAPMLVFLYYIAFVAGPALVAGYQTAFAGLIATGWLPDVQVRDFSFEWRAITALTLCYSGFLAEIIRAGIEAVPRGQVEAARALGLPEHQVMRRVVLPQALRTMLPPLGNDLIAMLKDSSLVSVLGVADITQIGKTYSAATFLFFETYTVLAFYYLVMTITLSVLVRRLEARLARGKG